MIRAQLSITAIQTSNPENSERLSWERKDPRWRGPQKCSRWRKRAALIVLISSILVYRLRFVSRCCCWHANAGRLIAGSSIWTVELRFRDQARTLASPAEKAAWTISWSQTLNRFLLFDISTNIRNATDRKRLFCSEPESPLVYDALLIRSLENTHTQVFSRICYQQRLSLLFVLK